MKTTGPNYTDLRPVPPPLPRLVNLQPGECLQPYYNGKSYTCPLCGVLSTHNWHTVHLTLEKSSPLAASVCYNCGKYLLWHAGVIVYPGVSTAPAPHPDLPDTVKPDYEEAMGIVARSPRGAAALLRLALQKLCKELGQNGKNIDNDIAALVRAGLPQEVQMALDSVRVCGNEAVHPGELDLRDDAETAQKLFSLMNYITQFMITAKKQVRDVYALLPEDKRKQIAKRDGTTQT